MHVSFDALLTVAQNLSGVTKNIEKTPSLEPKLQPFEDVFSSVYEELVQNLQSGKVPSPIETAELGTLTASTELDLNSGPVDDGAKEPQTQATIPLSNREGRVKFSFDDARLAPSTSKAPAAVNFTASDHLVGVELSVATEGDPEESPQSEPDTLYSYAVSTDLHALTTTQENRPQAKMPVTAKGVMEPGPAPSVSDVEPATTGFLAKTSVVFQSSAAPITASLQTSSLDQNQLIGHALPIGPVLTDPELRGSYNTAASLENDTSKPQNVETESLLTYRASDLEAEVPQQKIQGISDTKSIVGNPQELQIGQPSVAPVSVVPRNDSKHAHLSADGEELLKNKIPTKIARPQDLRATVVDGVNKPMLSVELAMNDRIPSATEQIVAESRVRNAPAVWAPSGATPHATSPNANLPQHVAQQISAAVEARQGNDVQIRLNPEELGTIRIILSNKEGVMNVMVFAERAETLDLMRRNAEDLSAGLELAGFGDADLQFDQGQSPGTELDEAPTEDASATPNASSDHDILIDVATAADGLDLRM